MQGQIQHQGAVPRTSTPLMMLMHVPYPPYMFAAIIACRDGGGGG
jgi:hypothetical protein